MENAYQVFDTNADGEVEPVLLNADLTNLLGDAANAAYLDYEKKPFSQQLSAGNFEFSYYKRFFGFDNAIWGSKDVERYGLVYQSKSDPGTVLFAFRGTSSLMDAIMDLESLLTNTFKPYNAPAGFPNNVYVGDGFYKIYADITSGMTGSMQTQLFNIIDELKPTHIIITGHSLGCPLGSLFALDIAASRPTKITNINFASPRVGTKTWKVAYDKYVVNGTTPTGGRNETIRIVNNYDWVPMLPSEGFPTYFKHIGREFPVSFTTKNYQIDEITLVYSWHSLSNYRYVIKKATVATPQGWAGEFQDAADKNWKMVSYNPFKRAGSPLRDRIESHRSTQDKAGMAS